MFIKKLKKFFRNPKLFLFDYFKHRLSDDEFKKSLERSGLRIEGNEVKSLTNKKPLNENLLPVKKINPKSNDKLFFDNITDVRTLADSLFIYLIEKTCFVQIVDTNDDHIFRIAVKSNDIDHILNVTKDYLFDGFFIEEVSREKHIKMPDIRSFCFRDKEKLFTSLVIELDPWYLSERYSKIYTNNYNFYCTHVDYKYMNKTVFASNPYFLQGKIGDVRDYALTNLMKLPPSVYDDFNFDVDVVFTWVDGQDPDWLTKKKNYEFNLGKGNSENYSSARYEQIDELRYAMRSIAAFFKGFRKIFIVTDKQIPWWLDTTHPKIQIIDHTEIFPNLNMLPVFNSHSIEANLHRISGLSKKFIYMNDDMFIWRPVNKGKFFTANGISVSRVEDISNVHGNVEADHPAWRSGALNGNNILEKKFGVRSYSYHLHCPYALDKDIINEMWNDFSNEFLDVSKSKFRSHKDISPLSFLYHAYSFINKKSIKEESGLCKSYMLNSSNTAHVKTLEKIADDDISVDFVCLNDGGEGRLTERVLNALSTKFPIKAEWEH